MGKVWVSFKYPQFGCGGDNQTNQGTIRSGVTIVSVAPAGVSGEVVRMARDATNGVASDHYSRSARNSPRTSSTEPLSASPYGDEDAQFQVRIGPHRHHHPRRCRRRAPTARPSLCFRLSVHAFHCCPRRHPSRPPPPPLCLDTPAKQPGDAARTRPSVAALLGQGRGLSRGQGCGQCLGLGGGLGPGLGRGLGLSD